MAAASTRTALANMFKTVYSGRDLTNHSKRKTPLGDKISKKDDFYGANITIPFNGGLNWGISPTLDSTTNPLPMSGGFKQWVITDTKQLYGRLTIDNLSQMRSKKDIGAWLQVRAKETEEILANMKMQRLGHQLWGDGSGALAQVVSVTGADPVTAITIHFNDAVHFDGFQGATADTGKQLIYFATNANKLSGGTKDGTTTYYRVNKVNRYNSSGNAVLTVGRVAGTSAGDPAATNWIYNYRFYGEAPKGIGAWIPSTDPDATTFFTMDRSDEPQMKAGWRGTWEGTIQRSAERLCSVMSPYFDPEFSALWLSAYRWWQLKEELTAQGRFYVDETKSLEFGTSALRMVTPSGSIPVVADPYCPNDTGWLLRHQDIEVHSTGPLIHLADEDLTALRLSDADGLEIRFRSAAEYAIPRPFMCGRFPISSD
jgi:hypothetical protein